MFNEQDITGVTVVHNTKQFIQKAYESIRKFHPLMKLVIIDGSDEQNDQNHAQECSEYLINLEKKDTYLKVIHTGYNIGHGKGINLGIQIISTPIILLFDSDIEMLESPLGEMLKIMDDDTYGVGNVKTNFAFPQNWFLESQKQSPIVKCLNLYFALIQLKHYKSFSPLIHHGAPFIQTMIELANQNTINIVDFRLQEYIKHYGNGTRGYRKKLNLIGIEGEWDKIKGKLNRVFKTYI